MKNHINFFIKLKFRMYGYHLSRDFPGDYTKCTLKNHLFFSNKDFNGWFGVCDMNGEVILPFGNYRFLGATRDLILVFNDSTLCMEGVRLDTKRLAFRIKSYSKTDGEVFVLTNDKLISEGNYSIACIRESNKRYVIMDKYGIVYAENLISYEKYLDEKNEACKLLTLRYDDSFAILTVSDNPKQYKTSAIININPLSSDEYLREDSYLPVLIKDDTFEDKNVFNFVGSGADINTEEKVIKITVNDNQIYEAELIDKTFCFFDTYGKKICGCNFFEVKPFVSNRAFVKFFNKSNQPEEFYKLIDEYGRIIKNPRFEIAEIVENFQKRLYGTFLMTLAIIKASDGNNYLVDKELHVYPELPDLRLINK